MTENILKYGDLIIIQGSMQTSQSSKKDAQNNQSPECSGFLSALGYTDNRVFLQTVPKGLVSTTEQLKVASNWGNYRDLVFQVWPKVSYDAHKQMKKLRQEKAKSINASDDDKAAFEERIKKMKIRMEEELEANMKSIDQFLDHPVVYGAEIQLMHYNSFSFLTSRVACSDSDKSAYKFELNNEFNSGMAFMFKPKFKIRQEGDPVQLKDQILLYSMKMKCYVNFANDKPIELDDKLDVPANLPVITAPFEHRQLTKGPQRYEAFVSQTCDCIWKVHHYREHVPESDKTVRGGDLVKLKHTEINAFLGADVAMLAKNPEVVGQKYREDYEFEEEFNSINTIWEVEVEAHEKRGSICSVTPDPTKPQAIRLRHLLTGKLLGIETISGAALGLDGGSRTLAVAVNYEPTVQPKKPTVIFRSFANNEPGDLTYDKAYGVAISDESGSYKYIKALDEEVRTKKEVGSKQEIPGDIIIYKPLDEGDLAAKKIFMTCESSDHNPEHAFILTKIGYDEEKELGFAASSVATLKYFRDVLKASKTADVNPNAIAKTLGVLKDLIFFVHKVDDTEEEDVDPVEYEGITVERKQRLLKDFKVIELLTEILYYPFQRKYITLDDIQNKGLLQIFQYCYRLIKHIIKEYRPNEIYASQWLEYYMDQAMKSNSDNDIKAESTLIELIDNNKKILDDKINTEMIAKFVGMLKENKNRKYVDLLKALCVCDGAPVSANQQDMSHFIIEDKATRDHLIYQTFRKNHSTGKIEIRVKEYESNGIESWFTLSDFQMQSKESDGGEKFNYFISMIYLLADLCLGRNYIAIDFLQTVYTYENCFQIITEENPKEKADGYRKTKDHSHFEIKSAFATLMNNLWLDTKPYRSLNVPQYLILWDEINPTACNQIACTNTDISLFDGLKDYLKAYFTKLADEGCTRIDKVDRNKFTFITLKIATRLVDFGIYKYVERLNGLLKPLLVILNGMQDVASKHEYEAFKKKLKNKKPKKTLNIGTGDLNERNSQRYEENERNNIVMDCKNQICELIKIVLNIDDDLRLRQYMLEFKNELNANKSKDNDASGLGKSPDKKSLFKNYQKLFRGNNDDQVDFVKNSIDWIKGISDRNAIDLNKLAPTNFVRILFDLCLYQHEDLVNNSFELLNNTHSQRMRLLQMLEDVHILEDPEKKRIVLSTDEDIRVLREIAEQTELWYHKKDAKSIETAKKCTLLVKKLASQLVNDSLLFRGQNPEPEEEIITKGNALQSPDALEDDDIFDGEQGVDSEFQIILRSLKAHEPLLEILKFESDRSADPTNEVRVAVIREICRLLTKFALNAKNNQAILVEHMKVFLTILTRYASSGVDELIEVLFKNNRTLIRQGEEVKKFAKSFLEIISQLKISNPKSSKMLMSLEPFMRYKNTVIKANQTTVLTLLTQKQNSHIFITIDPKKSKEEMLKDEIFRKVEAFNNALKNPSGLVELPAELDYLSSLLEILACTCDGKNAVTESRCQSAWPMMSLRMLYKKAEQCWILKHSILMFIYHVYLDTERALREGTDLHNIIFEQMTEDMEFIAQNYISRYEIRYHKGSIDNKQAQEHVFFGAILPCINAVLDKRVFNDKSSEKGPKLRKMFDSIIQMKQLALSRTQRHSLNQTMRLFYIHAHEVYTAGIDKAKLDNLEFTDLSRDMSKRMSIGGTPTNLKDLDTKNLKLQQRLGMLLEREDLHECGEEEFEKMVSILIDIEKQEENNVYSSFVPFNEVIENLIELVTKEDQDKHLMFVGLKTFRKIIERENKDDTTAAADWEGDTLAKYQKKITHRQNELCNLGIVKMVCQIISKNEENIELQHECILVGIAMLLGGNEKVQKAFCDYIQNDASNDFMFKIKLLIEKNFDLVKKEMSLKNKYYLERLEEKENAQSNKKGAGKSLKISSPQGSSLEMAGSSDFDEEDDIPIETAAPDGEEAKQSLLILQRTYRFLQLFCEGHNLDMQNQLREQTNTNGVVNGKSQDFITRTAYYFNTLIKHINVDSLDFGVQMLDFLIEAMQGPCAKNQQALAKANIINSCMDFLMMFVNDRDYERQGFIEDRSRVNDATTTAVKVLNTLIECSNDPEIIEEMGALDFKFLVYKLSQEYETFVTKTLKLNAATVSPADVTAALNADSFNQQILESFDVYILMANLAEANPKVAAFLKNTEDFKQIEKDAMEFFKTNLADIEIKFKDKLLKVYFPIYPLCRHLSRDSRKDLMANVNRDSANEKVMGLVNASDGLFDEMSHMAYLKNQIFVFNQTRYNFLRDISTVLSLVINIIILCVSYYSVSDDVSYRKIEDIGELSAEQTINVLGIIQICTSSLMIVFWIIINSPIILRRKWREFVKSRKSDDEKQDILSFLDDDLNPEELPLEIALKLFEKKGPYDPIFNPNGKRNYGHLFVRLVCYWKNLTFVMTEGKFIYMVFYLIISILGVAVSEITYCFHLLDVINRFDTLRNVVKSVTHNLNQLLLTSLLGIILIYIYALIGFYFIDEMYYNSDVNDGVGERSCTSMFHCYMTTLNYGLRNGGGIGESLTFQSYVSTNRIPYFFRLIFDLSFFIIINVVFLNIIFGIIIDTFAELRDRKNTIDEDMKTKCFICNNDRYTFDKNGTGFENHIEKHHHLWNYLFYIYSVKAKDATEYNGIESYVQEKLETEDASWFPLLEAIELNSSQNE